MSLDKQEVVSAQVVLRPASGKRLTGEAHITADNLSEYLPSPQAVTRVRDAFAADGFQAGAVGGNSFAITAPVHTFERVFQTTLRRGERGEVQAVRADGSTAYELPLEALPRSVADLVEAITFTPPPDFGPTNFF